MVDLTVFVVDAVHDFSNCSTTGFLVVVHLAILVVDAVHVFLDCSTREVLGVVQMAVFVVDAVHVFPDCSTTGLLAVGCFGYLDGWYSYKYASLMVIPNALTLVFRAHTDA